jgi:hypothetical protein
MSTDGKMDGNPSKSIDDVSIIENILNYLVLVPLSIYFSYNWFYIMFYYYTSSDKKTDEEGNDLTGKRPNIPKLSSTASDLYLNPYSWDEYLSTASSSSLQVEEKVKSSILHLVNYLKLNYLMGPYFTDEKILSELEAQLQTILDSKTESQFLKSTWSSQLSYLYERISMNKDKRILIFVETRYTAKILTKFLSSVFPDIPSDKVIGQNGFDGMFYRGISGQEKIINKFRSGEIKMLISTSVLEEGLDVSCCNLVFRFGGIPRLIQIVQSRGRARAKDGKLVVIFSETEKKRYDQILKEEEFINMILNQYSKDANSNSEIDKIIENSKKISNENLKNSQSIDDREYVNESNSTSNLGENQPEIAFDDINSGIVYFPKFIR